eukprot:5664913-Amphidinium_carterae.1
MAAMSGDVPSEAHMDTRLKWDSSAKFGTTCLNACIPPPPVYDPGMDPLIDVQLQHPLTVAFAAQLAIALLT